MVMQTQDGEESKGSEIIPGDIIIKRAQSLRNVTIEGGNEPEPIDDVNTQRMSAASLPVSQSVEIKPSSLNML